jgi:hypothetical protein
MFSKNIEKAISARMIVYRFHQNDRVARLNTEHTLHDDGIHSSDQTGVRGRRGE